MEIIQATQCLLQNEKEERKKNGKTEELSPQRLNPERLSPLKSRVAWFSRNGAQNRIRLNLRIL